MDRITPLERELLKSVEKLVDGTKQDVESLRAGLIAYENTEKNDMETRLNVVEERLTAIEATLNGVLNGLGQRMENYEKQTAELNRLLNRLNQ